MQDLGMKRVVAEFVQGLLLPEQKEHRAAVANDVIQTATNEPHFLKKVITGDESCVCRQLRSGKGSSVVPMEVAWFSMPMEGAATSQQDQDRVNCGKLLCITSPLLQAKQLIRSTSSTFFIGCEMQYNKKGRSSGQLVIGSLITTMCALMHHVLRRVFSLNIRSPR